MEEELDKWQKKRKDYIAVAIICFIIGMCFLTKVKSESYIIKTSELKVIENLIISEKPKFKETKGKRGRQWIEFKCVNNKSTFEIANFDYLCVNDSEALNEIKKSDTILIKILNEDLENFDNETTCEIHSLIKNGKEYLDMECRNEADNNDRKKRIIILFSLSVMCGIIYSFSEKPKFFNGIAPEIIIGIITIIIFILLRIHFEK
jgi:hypothetical protein